MTAYINCDRCENLGDPDADYFEGLEMANGEWYEHVCYDCWEEISSCEICDRWFERDDMYWCENIGLSTCDDHSCMEDAHERYANNWTGYCYDCEFGDEACKQEVGPWAEIIG